MIHTNDTQRQYLFTVKNLHLNDVNPVKCGWHKRDPEGSWGPYIHTHYSFHYVLSGKGEYTVGGKTYLLEKNSLFLIRPNEVVKYKADKDDPWIYSWISFSGQAVDSLLEECGLTGDVYTIHCQDLYGTFDEFRHIVNKDVSAAYLNSRIYGVIDRLQAINTKQSDEKPVSRYCSRAVDFIQANYQSHITIDGISKDLGIDRRYFSRIFTQYIGVSPQKYLVDYRLERARSLLAVGAYSVYEVAISVGYDDVFAFSKIFKKKYGVSPSKYVMR